MKKICRLCNKEKEVNLRAEFCDQCIQDIRDSFHYSVGNTEVSKPHFDAIKKRGYVIPEELDEDRK